MLNTSLNKVQKNDHKNRPTYITKQLYWNIIYNEATTIDDYWLVGSLWLNAIFTSSCRFNLIFCKKTDDKMKH